ncbi:MAG: biotin synthase BioB [Syntrophotaleaceae bacterium]
MRHQINQWTDKVLSGGNLSAEDGLKMLHLEGADLAYLFAGAQLLREHFFGRKIALCSIINAKSGLCREDCAFCAQSAHHQAEAPIYPLKDVEEILAGARLAEQRGCRCYGIVTSGNRLQPGEEMDRILTAIREIRRTTSIRPSASLGFLDSATGAALAAAGCITYHHNLETARSFFHRICTTHDYEEAVETVRVAKAAGMAVCSGGIFGLGEDLRQRVELATTLRDLKVDSIPLNFLAPVPGTPLGNRRELTPMDCLRIIALFRYLLPDRRISVCGGRELNLREFQSWIFLAGASGVMVGNYLTRRGRELSDDLQLIEDAGLQYDGCP